MKKFLSLVLALIMTMSLVTISAGAKDFTDADEVNYDEAIDVLSALKVVEGYPDESFKPAKTLTRAEAAKIICNMILGPTTAAALSASVAPFSDVAADNWAAGYITYCAQQGIIAGYGNGAFGPTDTLTGYQFMKMLLGALGYDAKIEGYVGTNYSIPVAKQAANLGLSKGLKETFNGNEPVTREEACLYALNTLKADLVEYSTSLTVNNGALDTLNVAKAQQWNNSATKIENIKADDYIQFAEQYFPKLELEIGNGIYGRPANTWKLKKVEIGTFTSIEPTKVYKEETDGDDIYKDLGKVICDEKEYDWTAFVNGEEVAAKDVVVPAKGMKDYAYTDDGAVTEIYVDDDAKTVTVVEINYYIGQVSKVKSDDDGEYITVKALSSEAKANLDDNTFYVEGYKEDDYVVFTVDFNDDEDFVIGEVCEPETVTGEVKRVDTDKDDDNKYLKLADGEKYPYSGDGHIVYDLDDATKVQHPTLNKEYILYMDPNGFVLGFELAEEEVTQYLYVKDSDEEMDDWRAKVYLTDATKVTVDVNSKVKSLPDQGDEIPYGFKPAGFNGDGEIQFIRQKDDSGIDALIWKYSVNSKNVYTLTYVEDQYKMDGAEINNGKSYVTDGENEFIVDMKTVFVDMVNGKSYTGYKDVPNVDDAKLVYVLDGKNNGELDGKLAKVVFILSGNFYDQNATYFVLADDTRESGKFSDDNYWEYTKAYVNGEKTPLKITYNAVEDLLGDEDERLEVGVLYKATKTIEDGEYIDELEEVVPGYEIEDGERFDLPIVGVPYKVADNAFWLDDGWEDDEGNPDIQHKELKFDTDDETVYVTVRFLVSIDKKGDIDWECKVADGDIKDLKALESDDKTEYSDKYAMVVKADNDNTARLVYIGWVEYDVPETKTLTVDADNATVKVGNRTVTESTPVLKGGDATLTITADEGFEITKVTVNGTEIKLDKDGKYTISEITKDQKVVVETAEIVVPSMTILVTYTDNGEPVAEEIVTATEDEAVNGYVTVTATVPEGYKLAGKLNTRKVAFTADGTASVEFAVVEETQP